MPIWEIFADQYLEILFSRTEGLVRGLAIEKLETEWKQYPILHFDLSTTKNRDSKGVRSELDSQLILFEKRYGIVPEPGKMPSQRLANLIRNAHQQTGQKTVVIIDEYDAPMLDVLHETEKLDEVRRMIQEFYAPLKACDADLRFVFITGITKFSQLSIFSVINNLTNISMDPEYSAICGITKEELHTEFEKDIAMLAEEYECTSDEMKLKLKGRYDGYHFSERSADIYNPFSILKAFDSKQIKEYWFESGTPTYLVHQIKRFQTDLLSLDDMEAFAADFDRPTETMNNALPLLYQSGYITIKKYDKRWEKYTLGFPNNEVKVGLTENLLPDYAYSDSYKNSSFIMQFC